MYSYDRRRAATSYRWKGNKAQGKHTEAEVSKGVRGWAIEVSTNWGRKSIIDTDFSMYKADAKEIGEEMMAKYDREIEGMGRENWA